MASTSEYMATMSDDGLIIRSAAGQTVTLSADIINSSLTLRNIMSSGSTEEALLCFPACVLETWLECVASSHEYVRAAHDTRTIASYLEACDYFVDEQRLKVLCEVLGGVLFRQPSQAAARVTEAACRAQEEIRQHEATRHPPSAGTEPEQVVSGIELMQILSGLAPGLAAAVLRATPCHLDLILARLPPSMHILAISAQFPEVAASGTLQLDSNAFSLATVSSVLEWFAGLCEGARRAQSLAVTGVSHLVPARANAGSNNSVQRFSRALLECCMQPPCSSISLSFKGDKFTVPLETVLKELSTRDGSLHTLKLCELPNIHFFSFTSKSRLNRRNEQAEILAELCVQLYSLRHLEISNQTKWADNIVQACACWDFHTLSHLTHLSMHAANCCVCVRHLAATLVRCTQLKHLGVCITLRKCPPNVLGHNHTWLSQLINLTSLTLRCADERVSFRNGVSFTHGGGDANGYLNALLSSSLTALRSLQQLDISQNIIAVALLQCVVRSLHSSLRELAVGMHVCSAPHALAVVHLLHSATSLSKLSFNYHYTPPVEGGVPEETHATLCKYLCCLPALRRLRLCMHSGPYLPVSAPSDVALIQRIPIETIAQLTHVDLNSSALLRGLVATGNAHLASLQHVDVVLHAQADADGSVTAESLQFAKIVAQQDTLQSLCLRSCALTVDLLAALVDTSSITASLTQIEIHSSHDMPAGVTLPLSSFIGNCRELTTLQLHIRVLTRFIGNLAAALAQMRALQHITLQLTVQHDTESRIQCDCAYMTLASGIARSTNLRSLEVDVTGSDLADEGAVTLAKSLSSTLQGLILGNVQISDRLFSALAASVMNLKRLKLQGSDMNVDAATALAQMLTAVPSLRSVSGCGRQGFVRGPDFREASGVIVSGLAPDDPTRCVDLRSECE